MVSAPALRVVFFGTPEFAVPTLEALLASRHTVVAAVTQPDRPRGRGQKTSHAPVKAAAVAAGLPVLQPDSLRAAETVAALSVLRADLGVVAAYGKILTADVLALPRLGLINVHASLLPRYRGAAPVHRAIVAAEQETGITIMRVVKALDAGPMLAKAHRPIGPDETSEDVERDLARIGAALAVSTIDLLLSGGISETPQSEADATYARRLIREDGAVDWSRPAGDVHNLIRGMYPWPHAFTFLGATRYILLRSSVEPDGSGLPGTIVEAAGDRLRVAAGSGIVSILEIQAEGKRPMSAREFLAGRPLRPGAMFGHAP
jgi:methionyl-tRNA formyltransferase